MNLPTTPDLIDREQFPWDLLKHGWNSPNDAQHTKAREFADALNDCHREKLANATAERDEARAELAAMRELLRDAYAAISTCQNHCYSDGMLHHQTFDNNAVAHAILRIRAAKLNHTA